MRPIEQSEQLVGGELFERQRRTVWAGFGGSQPGVGTKINLGRVGSVCDGQAGETVTDLFAPDVHPDVNQGVLDDAGEHVDIFA